MCHNICMTKQIRVTAAVIEKDYRILIARRLYGNQAGKWEFPGGKYEEGEDGISAVKREIREEFEVDIEVSSFLCTVKHRYPEFSIVMDCYICRFMNDDIKLHDHSEIMWIPPKKRGIDWAQADKKVIRAYRRHIRENCE